MSTERTDPIIAVSGQYRFLSNFYPALDSTVEHHFQAAKAADPQEAEWVMAASTPGEAKRRGRRVTKRSDWDEVRISVMRHLLRKKFEAPILRSQLLGTGDRMLIEGNTWGDKFWGAVFEQPPGHPQSLIVGENHLGKLLMEIRSELREGEKR